MATVASFQGWFSEDSRGVRLWWKIWWNKVILAGGAGKEREQLCISFRRI